MKKRYNYNGVIILALAFFASVRIIYLIWGPFDLSPDEAHYWEWSRRLDLSYYSKGPAVAYVIAFFTAIFGNTAFGVRIGAVVFSTLASYLLYLIAADVFEDSRNGFYAALLANIVPIFSAGSVLMTTDVLFVFFWAAAIYCVLAAIKDNDGKGAAWWYLTGVSVGLGFLSKYTMALLYPCLLLFLAFSKKDRFWLKRFEPYTGALLSLVIATPVIYWNISHGLVTIRHTMGQAHVGSAGLIDTDNSGFTIMPLLEFIGSQAALITPLIFAGGIYGLWRCVKTGLREGRSPLLLAFFTSAPLFLFFCLASLNGKVQGNWAIASYVTAFAATPWAFTGLYRQGRAINLLKTVAVVAISISVIATVIAYEPAILEPLGFRHIIDRPPFNRVTGWKELGARVSELRAKMPPETGVFIMSDTYQITSELAFYTEGQPMTYNAYTGERRMNQYDLWPGYGSLKGSNAIYVKGGSAVAEDAITEKFDVCTRDVFMLRLVDRPLKEFTFFRCYNFKGGDAPGEIHKF